MNKKEYEAFIDCRIQIYEKGASEYEHDLYAEIENIGENNTPEHPVKVRFIKPTENGLVYLDDGSVKTMDKHWFYNRWDFFGVSDFIIHDKKHYAGLQSLWRAVMREDALYTGMPKKTRFGLESICKAFESCKLFTFNEEKACFEHPQPCPKIKELIALQHQMNETLALATKKAYSKNIEPEMER